MTTAEQCELDKTMDQLDALIRNANAAPRARVHKSVGEDDAAQHGEAQDFPPTRVGLAAFAKSQAMQALLVSDPITFRQNYLDFILQKGLVRNGECSASDVAIWGHQLASLVDLGSRQSLSKALAPPDTQPRPWDFASTQKGLDQFLHSQEMQVLAKSQPAQWRQEHLDFFASTQPAPNAKEISVKRLELECSHPDHDPSPSTMTKARVPASHLTHGQSVLVQNFGGSIGDPGQWMIRR